MEPLATLGASAATPIIKKAVDALAKGIGSTIANLLSAEHLEGIEQRYRETLIKELGKFRILGHTEDIDLDEVFAGTRVLTQDPAVYFFDGELVGMHARDLRNSEDKVESFPAEKFVRANNRLFVQGLPGAGKTTMLKSIARQAARGLYPLLPIFVPLRDLYEAKQSVDEYLVKALENMGLADGQRILEKLLVSGDLILLFDGIDEVSNEGMHREILVTEITSLSRQYLDSKIIITCRSAAFERTLPGYKYLFVAPFDEDQQSAFINGWFINNSRRKAKFIDRWKAADTAPIRSLASSPLMLALVCLSFDRTSELSGMKTKIFRNALEALLVKWDHERDIHRESNLRQLDLEQLDRLYQFIAYKTLLIDRFVFPANILSEYTHLYLSSLPDVVKAGISKGVRLAKEMEALHGLITAYADSVYGFSHPALHEYLAARYLHESSTQSEFEALLRVESFIDSRWPDVWYSLFSMKAEVHDVWHLCIGTVRKRAGDHLALRHLFTQIDLIASSAIDLSKPLEKLDIPPIKAAEHNLRDSNRSYSAGVIEAFEEFRRSYHPFDTTSIRVVRRIQILETCIRTHFNGLFEYLGHAGWTQLVQTLQATTFLLRCLALATTKVPKSELIELVLSVESSSIEDQRGRR